MHYFEITSWQFASEIADYLPKEAFPASRYVLLTTRKTARTILITDYPKLGELIEALCFNKHCKRISKRILSSIKAEASEGVQSVIGNLEYWEKL